MIIRRGLMVAYTGRCQSVESLSTMEISLQIRGDRSIHGGKSEGGK
jgi:hypothetical protein